MRISTYAILATIIAAPFATTAEAAEFNGPFVGTQMGWNGAAAGAVGGAVGGAVAATVYDGC